MKRRVFLLAPGFLLPIGFDTSPTTTPNTPASKGKLITTPGKHHLPGPNILSIVVALDQTGTLHHTINGKNTNEINQWSVLPGWFVFVEADNRRVWTWTGGLLCLHNFPNDAQRISTMKTPADLSILYAAPAEVYERLSGYLTSDSAQSQNSVPASVAPQPKSESESESE